MTSYVRTCLRVLWSQCTARDVAELIVGSYPYGPCCGRAVQMARSESLLRKMAVIYSVDVARVPLYVKYFDIRLVPSIVFFFNAQHLKIEAGFVGLVCVCVCACVCVCVRAGVLSQCVPLCLSHI